MASSLIFTPPPLDLDPLELDILEQRGTFDLPPRQISDHLVNLFFSWIAPTLPVVNQDEFMGAYRGSGCNLSPLLLQAIYTIASRSFGGQENLEDPNLSPRAFYKKAKALYDAGYERNQTTVLQAVVLLSVYWDGPDDLRESGIFYWSHIGIALAQAQGLHTTERYSLLEPAESGLLKRIWWTLYTRDRSVAAAFGRPVHVNLADCTVEPLTEADFIQADEQQLGAAHQSGANQVHGKYFLQYIKLCQIMDLGPCMNLVSRATGAGHDVDVGRCELKLHKWLVSCPTEFLWKPTTHNFWAAMLQSVFHTIVCQLHLVQKDTSPASRTSAFHSATTIISIMEALRCHEQLQYAPSFVICHAVVSLVTLKSHLLICVPPLLHTTKLNIEASLTTLRALSRTWPVAGTLLELIKTIVGPGQISHQVETVIDAYRETKNIPDDDEEGGTVREAGTHPGTRSAHADKASGVKRQPPTTTVVFRKPKVKQVMLPESRLILQILSTETRWFRPAGPPSSSFPSVLRREQHQFPQENVVYDDDENTNTPATYFKGKDVGCDDRRPVPIPLEEQLNPETILQTLRRAIEMRGLVGFPTGDGIG